MRKLSRSILVRMPQRALLSCVAGVLSLGACVGAGAGTGTRGAAPHEGRKLSSEELAEIPNAFPTTWVPPEREELQAFYAGAKAMGNPERVGWLISALVRLDRFRIPITMRECGGPEAYYDGKAQHITICYEYLAQANRLLGRTGADVYGFDDQTSAVLMFTALHEIGHGVVDVLGLRFRGNEEDLADRFALLLALASGDEGLAEKFVQAPAAFFQNHAALVERAGGHRAGDAHSTSEERGLDALCLLYGRHGNPALEEALGARAPSCAQWYAAAQEEWNTTLSPHTRVRSGHTF